MRKWYQFWKRKRQQYTWCYCPGCKVDMVSNPDVKFSDTDLVRYECPCGTKSEWDFDLAPAPIILSVNGKPYVY